MLMPDSGDDDPDRILLFAPKANFERLCNADIMYPDGTLKSYSIRLSYLPSMRFWRGRHFPPIQLKKHSLDWELQLTLSTIMSDFKSGLISSTALQYPRAMQDGVNVLWCCSHLVWLVFEGSIPKCACFIQKTLFCDFIHIGYSGSRPFN